MSGVVCFFWGAREVCLASCAYGSVHQKEFGMMGVNMKVDLLHRNAAGITIMFALRASTPDLLLRTAQVLRLLWQFSSEIISAHLQRLGRGWIWA